MKYLIISSSLNKDSKSHAMAEFANAEFSKRNYEAELIDLLDYPLPFCDGGDSRHDENAGLLADKIRNSEAIVIATPVYNYDVNAALKNLVELTGDAWQDKLVAFMCAAGSRASYMSVMPFANSLMLDFKCVIIPRFVFATGKDFEASTTLKSDIQVRIVQLVKRVIDFCS